MTSTHHITLLLQPHLAQGLELWLEGEMLRFKAPKEILTPALMTLLKQNKEAILAWLRAERQQQDASRVVDEYPLAYTQGAIWMLYRFAPHSPAYNTTFACVLNGAINENAVRQAFHALLIRHPVLRSTFADTDLGPRQRVWNHLDMPLQILDGSAWNETQLDAWLNQEADAPFDLTTQSCLRVKLVRNSVRGDILIATIHHVGADLWALLLVAQDIREFYQRAEKGEVLALEPLAVTYRQHVEWQQQFMDSVRGRQERRFWQRMLRGAPMQVSLPADFARPPVLLLQSQVIRHELPTDTVMAIRQFCKRNGITPFVFVQTALQLLVHARTGAQDFLLGTPTMGRSRKGMDQVVGDFANPVVLRAQVQPQQPLPQLLQRVKRTLLAAMEHQEYPFPAVVQDCNPPRDSSRTPLFQLMIVWHQGNADLLLQDQWISSVLPQSGPRGAPYDVMLAVSDLGERFELNWTYQTSLYQASTVATFSAQLQQLMQVCLQEDAVRTVAEVLADSDLAATAICTRDLVREQQVRQLLPVLREMELCVLVSADARALVRLFVGCADPQRRFVLQQELEAALPVLRQQCQLDDLTLFPQLPRTADGAVDLAELALRPYVARTDTHAALLNAGYARDDLLVLRELSHLPTLEAEELQQADTTATPVTLPMPDLSLRPDAWVVGAPLPEQSDAPSHLFTALEQTAACFPWRGLILLDEQLHETRYPYSQLVEDARRAAAGFCRAGLEAGAIVLLQMQYAQHFFAVWWGALLAGLRPLNVAMPEHYNARNGVAQKLYNVAHSFTGLTVVADAARLAATQQWLGAGKPVISADVLFAHNERFDATPELRDPVAFLQLTSGSTGTPKAIQITHHGILHHIAASARHNQYRDDDISLNWLPFDHVVPILTTHLKDCVLGIEQVQLPTASVLQDPLLWLTMLDRYRVTYSWAPNFAYQRVVEALRRADILPALDLSCVRILMNAGEQVLAPVVQEFQAACAPFQLKSNAVQPAFGMAEACTCMTYNNESDRQLSVHFFSTPDPAVCNLIDSDAHPDALPGATRHGFVDLGSVVPGVEIRITDEHNTLVKEGVIGRLQIRGPVVTPGYLNNPDANAEAFVGDGWFNSGDLGFIWNRRLVLTGREKEMIVVRGANYYCFELEQVAATVPGVVPTFVAATGVALQEGGNSDALVLFYVGDGRVDASLLERQIQARVAEAFGVTAEYVIAVAPEDFYKTTSGKIQRGQFRKNFEKGFYAQQVMDWNQRHGAEAERVQTVFTLGWRAQEWLDTSAQKYVRNASEVGCLLWPNAFGEVQQQALALQGADVRVLDSTDVLQVAQHVIELLSHRAGPILLLAGQWPAELPTADALWPVLRNVQLLTQALQKLQLDEASAQRLVVAVTGQSPETLLLFKPLLETLRQESGLPALPGAVLAQNWTALAQLRTLVAGGISRVPVWLDGDASHFLQPHLRAVDVLAGNRFDRPALQRGGTYLVTGATGGLAQPLCDLLLREFQVKLILAMRPAADASASRMLRLQQLQARWGQRRVTGVQLADFQPATLQAALTPALQALASTRLDGVFHLAGALHLQPLAELDEAHWQSASAAKITGATHLAHYLQQHWPDAIFVQYGSLNAHFGGQSAGAYSVASAAQVALADHLNRHTSVRSWCLNWSVWQGVGMAQQFSTAELQMARNKGLLALDAKRDSSWIRSLLQWPPGSYYIGIDPQAAAMADQLDWFAGTTETIGVHLQPPLHAPANSASEESRAILAAAVHAIMPRVAAPQTLQQRWEERWQRTADGHIALAQFAARNQRQGAQEVPAASADETTLCTLWGRVLGRSVTDVTRSFFEYGGHSINATQLIAAINRQFGCRLTVAHLFQHPSVRELADLLRADVNDKSQEFVSLALQDCIARGADYRLDCINPSVQSGIHVIFLPTAAGICSAYLTLMSRLKDLRLYTLSMPLAEQHDHPVRHFADNALRLLEQAGIAPESVVLAGWSMGGVLGYEILQRWAERAATAPALVMLDSGFGAGLHPITFDADFQLLMFAVELGLTPEHFFAFNQQSGTEEKLRWLQQYLDTLSVEVSLTMLLEWSRAYRQRLQHLEHHVTHAVPANADSITLVKAALHPHGRDDLGWSAAGESDSNISWRSVQADHQGIVNHPDVAEILRQICQQRQTLKPMSETQHG